MIRLADYLARFLVEHGIDTVFMVTGGGAMHLDDALGQAEGLRYVCNQHEQACAIAAEGYTRLSGRIAAVCVTTGPGGTNALTGVLGQWLDSIPAIYISGQVRYDTTVASTGLPLRQFGDQEADIVTIVRSITKYAVMVTDPTSIRCHLEKALHLARSGRPGPVWLDIPLNVQSAQVDEASLRPYEPAEDDAGDSKSAGGSRLEEQVAETISRLRAAQRPVLLAGAGVRLAGADGLLLKAARRLNIPLQAAWDAIDLAPTDHPLYAGRPSSLGQRGANFIFQNADLLLSLGCRLNVRQIGYNFATVARAAYKIAVDIDPLELQKPSIKIDLPVVGDARLFLEELLRQLGGETLPLRPAWLEWCRERLRRYPPVPPETRPWTRGVDPYQFCQVLGELLEPGEVVVSANGAACVVPIQAMDIRAGQRHIVNSGCAAMGYGLPAAIGAAFANRGARVVCLEGDGSIQLNLQELQTVVHHRLPLKIFIFNNGGYLSIRNTQASYFNGRLVGEGPASGLSFPDLVKIARAYGLAAARISRLTGMKAAIRRALNFPGPILVDVRMPPDRTFQPRASSQRLPDGRMVSKPLEDMAPFLDREEFLSNMIIPPVE